MINGSLGIIGIGLWFIASFTLFLLFIAVPKEMATGFPDELQCEVYALARRGWGCARLGDFSSNPTLLLISLAVSFFCSWLFGSHPKINLPTLLLFVLQIGFVVCSAGFIRIIYFFQGHVRLEHLQLSIIATGCTFTCMFLYGWHFSHLKKMTSN